MSVFKGIGVSRGTVIGKVCLVDRSSICAIKYKVERAKIDDEVGRFTDAVEDTKSQIREIKARVSKDVGSKHVYILDTYIMILEDEMLINETIKGIKEEYVNAEWALKVSLDRFAGLFDSVEDEYLRGRKLDIQQLGSKIMSNLTGNLYEDLSDMDESIVIVAHDITPSDIIQMISKKVLGFVTDIGGKTSHTGIMAFALGIPAVVGLKDITTNVKTGDSIMVDGESGIVVVNPSKKDLRDFLKKQQGYKYYEEKLEEIKDLPAETKDGYEVKLMANIEYSNEIVSILNYGAEGIGLYRTEYLYLNRRDLPSEEDHFLDYKKLGKGLYPKSVVIRTLDIGADKFHFHLDPIQEANPALGLRGIRFSLSHLDIFKTQLRGILRASYYGDIKIMYPMISTIEEVREANKIVKDVQDELTQKGIPFNKDIEIGVLIETPSAVMIADLLAKEVNFFSIGTNDLIQYTLAIDRVNERVTYLYQPLHPSILRMIKSVLSAAHKEGISVGICGEMGGDPLNIMILLGLGEIRELSMNPRSIPEIKKMIRLITLEEVRGIADRAISLTSVDEINEFAKNEMERLSSRE
ncbi:MAG: phosphoenolpyruvate--protein phosphotransferase [Nitrospinae bacterium]|nr:phosphoenolpyruvate--protein phosphotransferase [Nitrospinota bacterium]